MLRVHYSNRGWEKLSIAIVLALALSVAFTGGASALPPPSQSPVGPGPSSIPEDSEALANSIYLKLTEKEKTAVLDGARALAAKEAKLRTEQAALDAAQAEARARAGGLTDAAYRELALAILVGTHRLMNGQDLAQWERELRGQPVPPAPGAPKPTGARSADPGKATLMTNSANRNLLRARPIKRLGKAGSTAAREAEERKAAVVRAIKGLIRTVLDNSTPLTPELP